MLNCLNYLKGQEGQFPNISSILATILYLGISVHSLLQLS
jgi:hypothetical protein